MVLRFCFLPLSRWYTEVLALENRDSAPTMAIRLCPAVRSVPTRCRTPIGNRKLFRPPAQALLSHPHGCYFLEHQFFIIYFCAPILRVPYNRPVGPDHDQETQHPLLSAQASARSSS